MAVIQNSVSRGLSVYFTAQNKTGVALSGTVAQTSTITLNQAMPQGFIRVRVYAGGGTNPTVISITATLTDGTTTTTYQLFNPTTAFALGAAVELDITSRYVSELTAMTTLTITTVLGGTSPTASMDYEIAGTN